MAGLAGPPSCAKIQLILLQPAESHDAPIVCEQRGFDATDAVSIPPFVALSYFVPDNAQSPTTAVVIDGQNVDVPNTLAAALRHIRSADDPLCTWIDPLCTGNVGPGDPKDVIKQNSDIYSISNKVIIWVDDATLPIQQQLAVFSVNQAYSAGEPLARTKMLEHLLSMPLAASGLCHCQPLFSKPWWHWQRVEALLDLDLGPKTSFCYGRYQLAWADFVSLVNMFQFSLLRVDVDYPVWLDQVLLQIPGNIPEMFREPFRSQIEGPVSPEDSSVWGCGPLFAHPQDILYWVSSPLKEHNVGRNLSRMSTRLCNRYRRRCRRERAGTEASTEEGSTSTPDEGGTSDAALQLWLSVLSQRARFIGDEDTTSLLQSALASMKSQGGSDTSTLPKQLADTSQPYTYRALSPGRQEIRVLLLHPSRNRDAELRCDLFPLDIEYWLGAQAVERLPYMALSYTWGPSDPAQFVCLGGRQKRITPSLFKALQEFRDPHVPVLLWVDAVCIDQSNIGEKNHQVGMMGMVYTHAGCVLAWIDDSEQGSWEPYVVDPRIKSDGLNVLMNALSWIEAVQFLALYKVWRHDVEDQPSLAEVLNAVGSFNFIHALNTLFRRNYWSRVWTMQEILLSHNVLVCYSGYTVYFQAILLFFDKVCNWFYPLESYNVGDEVIDNTQLMNFLHAYSDTVHGRSPSLLQAMLMSRERHATVRHDHIYGILGVADTGQGEQAIPDYGSTLLSVSHDIFQRVVRAEGNLDILSACEVRNHYSADPIEPLPDGTSWPTWLPDWSIGPSDRKTPRSVLFAQHSAATRGFRAARDTKPAIRFFDNDLRLIAIKGAVIDEVDVIYPDGLSIYRMKDRGWDIFCRSASARDVYGGIQNRLRAFRSTIMLGQQAFISDNMWPADADVREEELDDGDGGGGGPEESLEAPQRTSATPLDADVEVSGDDAGDGHLGKMQEHSLTNSLKCPYYPSRFFITRRGYSGRGPLSAQKGDAVVLFWGGKVPVILRKLKDGDAQGQQHLMLGECYIHGIMRGATMDREDLEDQEFFLRATTLEEDIVF